MKLVVPYIDALAPVDVSLIRLAEFLGIACEQLALPGPETDCTEFLRKTQICRDSCCVVNPEVMKTWLKGDTQSEATLTLAEHFRYRLVHALQVDAFHTNVVEGLSGGVLRAVQLPQHSITSYDVAPDATDICEAFAGLTFGPIDRSNDRVFGVGDELGLRRLISIGSDVFMATVKRNDAETVFLGSGNITDLAVRVRDASPIEYFSCFVAPAMALRHIFGEHCWRPGEQHAAVVVDDPLLRSQYGFLKFDALLNLTKRHNFHTTIAFIPHNYRRSAQHIATMFVENADRLALCFHGNDHGDAEFASTDTVALNAMLATAEQRMVKHEQITGLPCDRVMVFPQGKFSLEAMSVLRDRNYDAAVNTVPHPKQKRMDLSLGDLAAPAVVCYGRFPLFLRKDSLHTGSVDVAWNLFWGRPVVIVEHHGIFRDPQTLIDAVNRINQVAPGIRWSSVGRAVRNSVLGRYKSDGTRQIRAFSRTIQVSNKSKQPERVIVEWNCAPRPEAVEAVLRDGVPCKDFSIDGPSVTVAANVEPGMSEEFSVVFRNSHVGTARRSLPSVAHAFARRRLSEIRDNYVSKSPALLGLAKSVQRHLQH